MRHALQMRLLLALSLFGLAASGTSLRGQATQGNRANSPFSVQFRREWELRLTEPARLCEVGPVAGDKSNRLILIMGGKNKDDYKRKLVVMRWNGLQFDNEYTSDFLGTSLDVLLVGGFRELKSGPKTAQDKQDKSKGKLPAHQIVTTKGFYAQIGNGYSRLFDVPTDIRAALFLDKQPAQLITGQGDQANLYQVGETNITPSSVEPPAKGPGYVRFGVGTQEPLAVLRGGVRYIQSHWGNRSRWLLGLQSGPPVSNLPDAPMHATTGDRLVVYTLRLASRDKSFWETTPDDFEEAWRSEPLPGRVLDVRVGDPKNEGQEGILVLTAENSDRDRRLHFFGVASGIALP